MEQSHDQIKELKTIIKLHEKAIEIMKDLRLDEKDNKYKVRFCVEVYPSNKLLWPNYWTIW